MKWVWKPYAWSESKRREILERHGIDIHEVMKCSIARHYLYHPNVYKYPRQQVYLIYYRGYPIFVPFVEEFDHIFIKNAIPKREYK